MKPAGRRRRRGHDDKSARKEKTAEDAGSRRRRWLYESLVVVKESADPEEDFLASMAEMIAANDEVRASPRGLEELLAFYLALNAAEHHRGIVAAFRHTYLKYRRERPLEKEQRNAAPVHVVSGQGARPVQFTRPHLCPGRLWLRRRNSNTSSTSLGRRPCCQAARTCTAA